MVRAAIGAQVKILAVFLLLGEQPAGNGPELAARKVLPIGEIPYGGRESGVAHRVGVAFSRLIFLSLVIPRDGLEEVRVRRRYALGSQQVPSLAPLAVLIQFHIDKLLAQFFGHRIQLPG